MARAIAIAILIAWMAAVYLVLRWTATASVNLASWIWILTFAPIPMAFVVLPRMIRAGRIVIPQISATEHSIVRQLTTCAATGIFFTGAVYFSVLALNALLPAATHVEVVSVDGKTSLSAGHWYCGRHIQLTIHRTQASFCIEESTVGASLSEQLACVDRGSNIRVLIRKTFIGESARIVSLVPGDLQRPNGQPCLTPPLSDST